MTTTPDDVYRAISDRIGTALTENGIASNRVAVTERPSNAIGADVFVQVRPAGGQFTVPAHGMGLTRERVEVTTWIHQTLDPGVDQSIQLSRESDSILSRIDITRDALRGTYLDGLLETPLRIVSMGSPASGSGGDGSIRVTDVYVCDYEYGNPAALRLVWSSTAPSSLTGATVANLNEAVQLNRVETGSKYIWCLQKSTGGDLGFWHEGGRVEFYSDTNEPPSGPACGTVSIGGVTYRRWRSPYASSGLSAVYRVREV